jgi:hypothetical protein
VGSKDKGRVGSTCSVRCPERAGNLGLGKTVQFALQPGSYLRLVDAASLMSVSQPEVEFTLSSKVLHGSHRSYSGSTSFRSILMQSLTTTTRGTGCPVRILEPIDASVVAQVANTTTATHSRYMKSPHFLTAPRYTKHIPFTSSVVKDSAC